MPYGLYWERLEEAYRVGALPTKAAREARLAEIRSVRLITLNYCPWVAPSARPRTSCTRPREVSRALRGSMQKNVYR